MSREVEQASAVGKLEQQRWFIGAVSGAEVSERLQSDGEWVVRERHSHTPQLVISVRWQSKVEHVLLPRDDGGRGWRSPNGDVFRSVVELVNELVDSRAAVNDSGARLLRPVARPRWMLRRDDVRADRKIGVGQFGEVWAGKVRARGTWLPVVLKIARADIGKQERDSMVAEAKRMLSLLNRHVVRLIGVVAERQPVIIVLEHCSGGGLDDYLRNNRGLGVEQKVEFCLHAAKGMEYLSVKHRCVHRDLAARNCLISAKGELKISDFGLSRTGTYSAAEARGVMPIRWMAPETLKRSNAGFQWSSATDVWSFGVLMWEIFSDGEQPWTGQTNKAAAKQTRAGTQLPTPAAMPADVERIMRSCWRLEPDRRPSFTDLRRALDDVARELPAALSRSVDSVVGSSQSTTVSQLADAASRTADGTPDAP